LIEKEKRIKIFNTRLFWIAKFSLTIVFFSLLRILIFNNLKYIIIKIMTIITYIRRCQSDK